MPTTILDGEMLDDALRRRFQDEAIIDRQAARIADLEAALEQLRDRVQDEYDRIYISGVLGR